MTKTKILCTLGPASSSEDTIRLMIDAGMNAVRLNMTHGDYESHAATIQKVRMVSKTHRWPVSIIVDTKGPEVRTGKLEGKKVNLETGKTVILTTRDVLGTAQRISINYPQLPSLLKPGDKILLQDGTLHLEVSKTTPEDVHCTIRYGGLLGEHKGLSVHGVNLPIPVPTPKDQADIRFAIENDADFIAMSFVRTAEEVHRIRRFIKDNGGSMHIIAKIEHPEAHRNLDSIIAASDGVMIARGDLGVVMPLHIIPLIQKEIIHKCNEAGRFVITATEMLDSMINRPTPTRAEVTDVVNAILDGTDAIMLSGETAIGAYPIESVKMMRKLAVEAESILTRRIRPHSIGQGVEDSVSFAATEIAEEIGAKAIICCTYSGATAKNVSKYRPKTPIYATTPLETVRHKLGLVWGAFPLKIPDCMDTDALIDESVKAFGKLELVRPGDRVVITAGIPMGVAGSTNMILVREVKDGMTGTHDKPRSESR